MVRKGQMRRTVTKKECPGLDENLEKGETVFEYKGHKFGIHDQGIAVTRESGKIPFYIVPEDAVEWET